jgi:hypothetical protein
MFAENSWIDSWFSRIFLFRNDIPYNKSMFNQKVPIDEKKFLSKWIYIIKFVNYFVLNASCSLIHLILSFTFKYSLFYLNPQIQNLEMNEFHGLNDFSYIIIQLLILIYDFSEWEN